MSWTGNSRNAAGRVKVRADASVCATTAADKRGAGEQEQRGRGAGLGDGPVDEIPSAGRLRKERAIRLTQRIRGDAAGVGGAVVTARRSHREVGRRAELSRTENDRVKAGREVQRHWPRGVVAGARGRKRDQRRRQYVAGQV